jgi:hypothetical protein
VAEPTAADYAALRVLINEEDPAGDWPDEVLLPIFVSTQNSDGSVNVRRAAGEVWEAKAADYVELTDTTESGSSRRNSQAFDHAQKMAVHFRSSAPDPTVVVAATTMQSLRVVRPTRG